MSSAQPVTDQTWDQEVVGADQPVLVDFWAEWCGPCRMVSPVVEEIAAEMDGALKVVKLNIDENPDTTRRYQVMSIPTLLVLSGGAEQRRIVGAKGKTQILKEIQAVTS